MLNWTTLMVAYVGCVLKPKSVISSECKRSLDSQCARARDHEEEAEFCAQWAWVACWPPTAQRLSLKATKAARSDNDRLRANG